MSTPASNEYEAFQKLQDGLDQSASAARELAFFRADQKREWERLAQLYEEAKSMAFQLVSDMGGGFMGKSSN